MNKDVWVCLDRRSLPVYVFESLIAMIEFSDELYALRIHEPTLEDRHEYEFVGSDGKIAAKCYRTELKS